MPATCYSVIRSPGVRVTALDGCGVVETGACASATSSGLITIEETREMEDRQDYFTLNADAKACVSDTSPPIFKWLNLVITFCRVDPELFNILTGEPLVLDDAETPTAVGFRTREGSVDTVNFALEVWTRLSGAQCDGSDTPYGYLLYPWVIEGMLGDLTIENGLANFVINARTRNQTQWGVGPYNIRRVVFGDDEGLPAPLLTAMDPMDHRHMQLTTMPPPDFGCGCTALPLATLTVVDPGPGTTADLTIPAGTLPAYVTWGDTTDPQLVTSGTTVNHVYSAPGTYTVTLNPTSNSSAFYTGSVTVA